MKHIKTYMGICLGSLLMTMSSCEPDMEIAKFRAALP